jgi:predicted RNase H-like nuclease (RuvC/YqgF family)
MDGPDPSQAGSADELTECLNHLYVRADRPSLRQLELQTKHVNGQLPGTHLKRVTLGRSTVNDVLRGVKFPRKAFLLSLVEALGVDQAAISQWEEAWDRLAVDQAAVAEKRFNAEAEQLRRELTGAEAHIREAEAKAEDLHQQLAAARESSERLQDAEARAERAEQQAHRLRSYLEELEAEASQLRRNPAKADRQPSGKLPQIVDYWEAEPENEERVAQQDDTAKITAQAAGDDARESNRAAEAAQAEQTGWPSRYGPRPDFIEPGSMGRRGKDPDTDWWAED